MKKILITGASGFIGGFLVQQALDEGLDVWAGVRATSNRSRLQDKRIHFIDLKYDNPALLTEQISDFASAYGGAWDFVVHNAGVTKALDKNEFMRVNFENTAHLVDALINAQCVPARFALMSSLSTFPSASEKTFRPISPDDPQTPATAYGQSKLKAEQYLKSKSGFPFTIMRPTGVYGPGDKDYLEEFQMVKSGLGFTVGMIPQRLTFIYAADLARAVVKAAQSEAALGKAYFVADGDVWTDKEFVSLLGELLGKKHLLYLRIPLPLVHFICVVSEFFGNLRGKAVTLNRDKYYIFSQRNWICDTSAIKQDLGFEAQFDLRRGVQAAIDWYRQHGWL